MAGKQNFRNAFNGFNKEDVVQYIEYLNSKHNNTVNRLKSENQELLKEVEELRARPVRDPEREERYAALQAEFDALQEKNAELQERLCAKQDELAQMKQNLADAEQKAASRIAQQELEAYRRAERMERAAQERTQQIYRQVTGTLAETATQVDEAAEQFKRLSQIFSGQMTEMQDMVDRSRNALMSASATMYSIRPTEVEEK